MKKPSWNAIVGGTDIRCEVITALVHPEDRTSMVYVAKQGDENMEYLWYLPPQIVLQAGTDAFAMRDNIPADEMPCTVDDIYKMRDYGYHWHGMLPISKELALGLDRQGIVVYLLYSDGTETEVSFPQDITEVEGFIMFGVTVEDWLIHVGRLRDGEVIRYEAKDEYFEPIQVPTGKYRAITRDTGEEIEGFLLRCEGQVNHGMTFICPLVTYGIASLDENNVLDTSKPAFGPYVPVLPDTVVPVINESDELRAYRATGLTPGEIQEAVDLFKDTNLSVPNEIKGWVNRAAFHAHKCAEMETTIKALEDEVAALRVDAANNLKKELINRLIDEKVAEIDYLINQNQVDAHDDACEIVEHKSKAIALNEAIVSVFAKCDLQYLQCKALDSIVPFEILPTVKEYLAGDKICYGEGDIRNAIFEAAAQFGK